MASWPTETGIISTQALGRGYVHVEELKMPPSLIHVIFCHQGPEAVPHVSVCLGRLVKVDSSSLAIYTGMAFL